MPTYDVKTPLKPSNLPSRQRMAKQLAVKPARMPMGIDHLQECSISYIMKMEKSVLPRICRQFWCMNKAVSGWYMQALLLLANSISSSHLFISVGHSMKCAQLEGSYMMWIRMKIITFSKMITVDIEASLKFGKNLDFIVPKQLSSFPIPLGDRNGKFKLSPCIFYYIIIFKSYFIDTARVLRYNQICINRFRSVICQTRILYYGLCRWFLGLVSFYTFK